MDLIDDRGRLFGLVNVVDALVVLLVLAVVVAGVALVYSPEEPGAVPEPPEKETRYVTIDLGQQPNYIARYVSKGDSIVRSGTDDRLTITDVYVSPTSETDVATTVRAEVNGTVEGDGDGTFSFGDGPLRPGSGITLDTSEYEMSGRVIELDPDGQTLDTTEVSIEVKLANTPPEIVAGVSAGLTERTGEVTSARLVDTSSEPATVIVRSDDGNIHVRDHPRNEDVYLTVEVLARETPSGLSFHGRPLQVGSVVSFNFRTITVEGTVIEIDAEDDSASS